MPNQTVCWKVNDNVLVHIVRVFARLGYLPGCSAHRATPARPQVADRGTTFS